MSIGLLFLLLVLTAVVGIVVLVVVLVTAVPTSALPAPTAAARRHATVGGAVAVLLGGLALVLTAVAALVLPLGTASRVGLFVLAPSAAGAVHGGVLLLTEVTWPRPVGAVRSAVVVRRGLRDVAPQALSVLLAVLVGLLAAGVVTAGLLADPDGLSITRRTTDRIDTAGVFPGWPAGLPAFAGVGVVLALTGLVLQRAVTRPAVSGADPVTDAALRRASAHRAVRGATVATALTLGPLLFAGSLCARRVADPAVGPVLVGSALVGALVGVLGLVVLCLPAPAVPREAAYGAPDAEGARAVGPA